MSLLEDIFSRKRQRETSVNFATASQWLSCFSINRKYSSSFLWTILNRIFFSLNSVRFTCASVSTRVDEIIEFLEREIKTIVWQLWEHGYVVVDTVRDLRVVTALQKDKNGEVIVPDGCIVYYDDQYNYQRTSQFRIIRPILDNIDRYSAADEYLTSTYGSVVMLTGKTLPISKTEKQALKNELSHDLGIGKEREQFIISNADIDIKQVDFQLDKLKLQEKIKNSFELLCHNFNIPLDIVFSSDSTYANQQEAKQRYINDCISPIVEKVLSLGRAIIKNDTQLLIPSTDLSFEIDNVDTLEDRVSVLERLVNLNNSHPDPRLAEIISNKIDTLL